MQKSEVDRRDILKLGRTTSHLQMLSKEGVWKREGDNVVVEECPLKNYVTNDVTNDVTSEHWSR